MLTFLSFGAREPAHFSSNKTIKASEFRKGSPVLKVQESLLRRGSLCLCVCLRVCVCVWRGERGKRACVSSGYIGGMGKRKVNARIYPRSSSLSKPVRRREGWVQKGTVCTKYGQRFLFTFQEVNLNRPSF